MLSLKKIKKKIHHQGLVESLPISQGKILKPETNISLLWMFTTSSSTSLKKLLSDICTLVKEYWTQKNFSGLKTVRISLWKAVAFLYTSDSQLGNVIIFRMQQDDVVLRNKCSQLEVFLKRLWKIIGNT